MELTLQTFLIVCPLVFLASFVDSIAGGGGLISLPAYLLAGVPMHSAVATNKLSSATGTVISTWRLCKNKYVDWILVLPCIVMAVIGSGIGANISLHVSERVLKIILIPVVLVVAFYVMKKKDLDKHSTVTISRKAQMIWCAASALVVGLYDGFYGPGTGTFLILLLSSFAHFRLGEANGVAKSINLTTNLTSLTVYLLSGKVIILLGLAGGVFGIVGNYIGVSFFNEKGSKAVKPLMITVLVIFFIRIITELI